MKPKAFLVPALALAGFVALGLPMGSLGVAWPSMRATFHQPLSHLGVLIAVFTGGYLAGSVASGRLTARVGIGWVLAAGGASAAAGALVYGTAAAWAVIVGASILLGLAGGFADTGLNTFVALRYGVRGLNLLHASFGIGATIGPLVITALLANGRSWRIGYLALAGFEAALALGYLVTRKGWHIPAASGSIAAAAASAAAGEDGPVPPGATGRALVVVSVVLFFVYVGVEVTAGQWSYSLFSESRGLSTEAAGIWVGAFWACLTVGRLACGVAGDRVGSALLLDASMVGALAASILMWWSPTPLVGAIGLTILGFSLAAIFPTLIAVTPHRMGVHRAPAVIGYQVAAAALGGAVVPAGAGVLIARSGLEVVGPVLAATALVMAILHLAAVRLAGRRDVVPA